MKKIAIIGTAGIPARYGGFETLAHHLAIQLQDECELSVYCSSKFYAKSERKKYWNKARLFHLPLNANGIQSIPYDIISIFHALFYADVLIILGVSGAIVLPFVKLFSRKKIIVNIDGLEWRRDKWSKPIKKFLKWSEKLAVRYSDADITDNLAIKEYTAKEYGTLSHLIEYGADHTIKKQISKEFLKKYPFLKYPYAFKVCRIEPENNIHIVLEAFALSSKKSLVMVGNWNANEYGMDLKKKFETHKRIHLLDPIYDQEKLDMLRSNCHLYIHGHSAGGTNPSLVEAMYLGLPIIAFDVSYNRCTTENKALFFKTAEELNGLIEKTTYTSLLELRENLKEIANRRYTWPIIAKKYLSLINAFDYKYTKSKIQDNISEDNFRKLMSDGFTQLKNSKMFYE